MIGMSIQEKGIFPLQDIMRVSAGILALIILLLSYMADSHVDKGVLGYIFKSYFAFSMALGGIMLILGSFVRIAAGIMIAGLWMGYYAMLLGNSLLIPVSFTLVLLGVIIKGPGRFTITRMMRPGDF